MKEKSIFIDALGGIRIVDGKILEGRKIIFPICKPIKVLEIDEASPFNKSPHNHRIFELLGRTDPRRDIVYHIYEEEV